MLERIGVRHGFGVRGSPEPAGLLRPRQVHGRAVARVCAGPRLDLLEADAVVSDLPGVAVGVVTADCVPILVARVDGSAVAAIHAGWRGLAAGVIEAALDALRQSARAPTALVAVIGPHISAAAYEVDEPVLDLVRHRFGSEAQPACRPTRAGHAQLDLAGLALLDLERAGVPAASVGLLPDACTYMHAERFHSYRRDGAQAGRLLHFVAASPTSRPGLGGPAA